MYKEMSGRVSPAREPRPIAAGDLTFGEIFRAQLRGFWLLPLLSLICVAGALALMATRPFTYSAMITVASSDAFSAMVKGGGPSESLSLFRGMNEYTTPFQVYMSMLTSRTVAEKVREDEDLMHRLFADRWDAKSGQWVGKQSALDEFLGLPYSPQPSLVEVTKVLNDVTNLEPLDRSDALPVSIFKVTVTTRDAALSRDLLLKINQEADDIARSRFRTSTVAQIEELTRYLDEVTNVNIRATLLNILNTLLTQEVFTRSEGHYAIVLLDDQPFNPMPTLRPKLFLAVAIVMGVVLGMLINMLRLFRRSALD